MRAFKRGKVWVAEWPRGRVDGVYRYHRKSGFPTKAAATRYAYEMGGRPDVQFHRLSFAAFTDLWLGKYAALTSPRTYAYYTWQARHYLLPYLGTLPLSELSPAHCRGVYAELRKRVQESTVLKVHRQLKLMCKTAMEWQLLRSNPVALVPAPKPRRVEPDVYGLQEIARLLAAAQATPIYSMLMLMVYTGLTRSETLGLQWGDLDGNVLQVRRTRQLVERKEQTLPTKRERRNRYVVLPPEVLDALPPRGLGQAWLFDRSEGSMTYWMRVVSRKAGLTGAKFHMLRHAFASIALQQQVPLTDVSAALGHADASVTARVYAHALSGHQEATAAKVAAALQAVRPQFAQEDDNSSSFVPERP